MNSKRLLSFKRWCVTSVWSFPALILLIFSVLTVTGINGSSVGFYHQMLYGKNVKDPGLLHGSPKSIRSDEFLIFSPNVISQIKADFPKINPTIGSGRDLVIIPEAPTKNWVGLFRPHTVAYFVMPFANAFAFAWWIGMLTLITSCYFFLLRVLDKKKLLAIMFSLSLALSPFIMWWYQITILLGLTYFFTAAIILMRMFRSEKIRFIKSQKTSDIIYAASLAYIGASLGLLLYAPFLIPIAIVFGFFMAGYVIDGVKSKELKIARLKKCLIPLAITALFVGVVCVGFYLDRHEMIKTISNSIYPGDRQVESGYLPFSRLYRMFDAYLMPLLQYPPVGGSYYTNQSEASNFILLVPFLIIPGILLQIYDYRKTKRINWTLILIHALALLFIARITIPVGDIFYKLLLLNRVPNNRLMIGLGLVGFLQTIYLIKYLPKVKIPGLTLLLTATIYSFVTLLWLLVLAKFFYSDYLAFKHNEIVVGSLAVFFTAIGTAILLKQKLVAAALLLAFTVLSSFWVLPLQKGMAFYEDSQIINKIQQVSAPHESWAVVDNFTFESLPTIAGRKLVNGRHPYTDFSFWHQLDKDGSMEDVYNRQAHVLFITDTAQPGPFLPANFATIKGDLQLVKGNVFKVRFACYDFVYDNVDFALATRELNLPCLELKDKVTYPNATFYIYRVKSTY